MADSALISKLDIAIRGNTTGLDSAVDRAGGGLRKFQQTVNQTVGSTNTSLSNIGNGVSGAVERALTDPIGALKSVATSLGSVFLNALLHPIDTIKNAWNSTIGTFQSVGRAVLGIFGKKPTLDTSGAVGGLARMGTAANVVNRNLQALGNGAPLGNLTSAANVAGRSLQALGGAPLGNLVSGANQATDQINNLGNATSSLAGKTTTLGGSILNALLHPFQTLKGLWDSVFTKTPTLNTSGVTSGLRSITSGANVAGRAVGGIRGGNLANLAQGAATGGRGLMSLSSFAGMATAAVGAAVVGVLALAAAFVGLAAGGLMLANQQAPIIASMHRTAQTLGMTTNAFSGLASTSGMAVEEFTGGLEHLERTLSETALNGGATAATLARIGLNAQQLNASSPEEQLRRIATALQGVTNQGDRLRITQELFGRSAGFDMSRILGNGAAGLDELQQRAERFGLNFTASQAETVARSNRAWGEWSLGLQGIGRSLAVALAPMWEYLGTIIGNFFAKVSQWVRAAVPYIQGFFDVVKSASDAIISAFQPVTDWIVEIWESVSGFLKDNWASIVAIAKQYFNVLSAYWRVLWGGLVAYYRFWWETVSTLWGALWEGVKAVFSEFSAWFGGSSNATWKDWLDTILNALIVAEFLIQNWQRVFVLAWDKGVLAMVEFIHWFNPLVKAFEGMVNSLIDGMNYLIRTLSEGLARALNWIIDKYNQMADTKLGKKLGLEKIDINFAYNGRQLEHVRMDFANFADDIEEMQRRIALQEANLGSDLAAFMQQRLRDLQQQVEVAKDQTQTIQRGAQQVAEQKDNKAAERNTAEAFSIIVGEAQSREVNALIDINRAVDRGNAGIQDVLRELQRRQDVNIARV